MYENISSFGPLINKVIIRLPIQEHLAPPCYQKPRTIITFNPLGVVSGMYICTALNVDFYFKYKI